MKKMLIYDDYNSNIPKDQNTIGTIRQTFGVSALRNGWKIIEIDEEDCLDFYGVSENFGRKLEWQAGSENMIKKKICPTIRAVDYKIPKLVWYVNDSNRK